MTQGSNPALAAEQAWTDWRQAAAEVLEAFETEVAEYLGVKHAIGVGSGTDALVISLRSLGIGRGDEVITTPFTFVATAEAICNVGAKPVFVDIDPVTFNIDAELVEAAVTPATRAVIPVHLFGRLQGIAAIDEQGCLVREDDGHAGRSAAVGKTAGVQQLAPNVGALLGSLFAQAGLDPGQSPGGIHGTLPALGMSQPQQVAGHRHFAVVKRRQIDPRRRSGRLAVHDQPLPGRQSIDGRRRQESMEFAVGEGEGAPVAAEVEERGVTGRLGHLLDDYVAVLGVGEGAGHRLARTHSEGGRGAADITAAVVVV